MLVGSIDASCAGQTAVIDFEGDRVVVRFPDYRTAGKMQLTTVPNPALFARVLRFSGQSVFAQVGSRREMELFPNPGWIARLLSPQLRRIVKT